MCIRDSHHSLPPGGGHRRESHGVCAVSYTHLDVYKRQAGNGRKLLVIKDSYAHTLVPLLAHHYEAIEMIDPRYYRQDLYAFAEEQEIDEALLVFGLANLDQETGLSTLYLGSE